MVKVMTKNSCMLLLIICVLQSLFSGCDRKPEPSAPPKSAPQGQPALQETLTDSPLEPFRQDLLQLAFETASSIPLEPHIKTRSEWQQRVVMTCLQLGQPNRAIAYIEKIQDWRQGLSYAQAALYLAENGCPQKARQLLAKAEQANSRDTREWSSDQVRIAIAQAQMVMGNVDEVERQQSRLHEKETGVIASAAASQNDQESFENKARTLDALIATEQFEAVKNALLAYAKLYDHFYADPEKRKAAENKIKASREALPYFIQYKLMVKLTESSIKHNDLPKALQLAGEIQALIDGQNWPLMHHVAMQAKLAQLRFNAGDRETAALQADAALNLFLKDSSDRSRIITIEKAEALVPLAETYQAMGNRDKTLHIYKLAVQAAVENPNSRPRAEDITDILCSLALHAVEPDAELKTAVSRQIAELGDPW